MGEIKVLISEEELQKRVEKIAKQMEAHLSCSKIQNPDCIEAAVPSMNGVWEVY